MVVCVITGCSKRSDRRDKDVSFFRIPVIRTGRSDRELELSTKRRDGFLAALSRGNLTDSMLKNARICSRHFISGKPAPLFDELNPDWLPTQNLAHSKVDSKKALISYERYQRKKARKARINAAAAAEIEDTTKVDDTADINEAEDIEELTEEAETQTEETAEDTTRLQAELNLAYEKIRTLEEKINHLAPFTESAMQGKSDDYVQHYTGLPNVKVLMTVYRFVAPKDYTTKLTPFQEFMVVLLKLQLNASSQDLAYCFDVSFSTISRILLQWLTVMDTRLNHWFCGQRGMLSGKQCLSVLELHLERR